MCEEEISQERGVGGRPYSGKGGDNAALGLRREEGGLMGDEVRWDTRSDGRTKNRDERFLWGLRNPEGI